MGISNRFIFLIYDYHHFWADGEGVTNPTGGNQAGVGADWTPPRGGGRNYLQKGLKNKVERVGYGWMVEMRVASSEKETTWNGN